MAQFQINKYTVQIDDEDFLKVSLHNWSIYYRRNGNPGGVICRISAKTIYLHRFVLGYTGLLDVDHKDQNIFNNQKNNLRLATQAQNIANQGLQENNTSGFKGVCWNKQRNKWFARLRVDGKFVLQKNFISKKEAALAFNEAAIKYLGEFAVLNRIED